MRELIVGNIISLDGYFEGPEKNVMLLPMEGFFDQHNLDKRARWASPGPGSSSNSYGSMHGYIGSTMATKGATPACHCDYLGRDSYRHGGSMTRRWCGRVPWRSPSSGALRPTRQLRPRRVVPL
jgi:hypothetical protein